MSGLQVSAWVAIPAAFLLVCGGLLTLAGCVGLLRLPTFYARMHAPTLGATLGTGCVVIASVLVSSAVSGGLVVHQLLIGLFLALTAPVTAILLMQGARSRSRPPAGEQP